MCLISKYKYHSTIQIKMWGALNEVEIREWGTTWTLPSTFSDFHRYRRSTHIILNMTTPFHVIQDASKIESNNVYSPSSTASQLPFKSPYECMKEGKYNRWQMIRQDRFNSLTLDVLWLQLPGIPSLSVPRLFPVTGIHGFQWQSYSFTCVSNKGWNLLNRKGWD